MTYPDISDAGRSNSRAGAAERGGGDRRGIRRLGLRASTLAIVLAPAALAAQQSGPHVVDPPEFVPHRGASAATLMAVGPGPAGEAREVRLDMNVAYLDRRIRNPDNGPDAYDIVRLRGYEDANAREGAPSDTPLVGPTISVRPGQTVRVKLHNQLPADSTCGIGSGGSVNTPHCFNGTNLHTHGLWVNPSGNGDNVLISIRPGVTFEYEYNIPPDHPAGTFWYHPHLHGSTALQVSSGMSGALVIRGDRLPEGDRNGDLDTLLKGPDGEPVAERILVLQQIQYACRDADGKIKTEGGDPNGPYLCEPGDVGTIEGYDQFGPPTWRRSGRHTSVNGAVLGRFAPAEAGAVERWRLIHAGVRDTINLELRPRTGDAPVAGLSAEAAGDWIDANCGDPLPYHVVAQDGLTMAKAQRRTETVLQPGYRVDALVVFPRAGEYCVVDADAPASGSVNDAPTSRRLLGLVAAEGDADVSGEDPGALLRDWLIAAAERTMPDGVREDVIAGLRAGLALSRFVPHADVCECDVTGHQELVFNIDVSQTGAAFFQIDGKPYDPNRIDRTLPVGGVEEWTLQSDLASHPFHIHVNPFQIVKILDSQGRDVSMEGAQDFTGGGLDPQYPGLKGVWKDTLLVKNDSGKKYTIVVRTRYERYIGDFVLHCHILDHEDQGMMQNIRIALPDGQGGTAHGHH